MGPSTAPALQAFSGITSAKITGNSLTVTIRDSADGIARAGSLSGGAVVIKQDGELLKITGNGAQVEIQLPSGVPIKQTTNSSTITDLRSGTAPAAAAAVSTETAATSPLASALAPNTGLSNQVFQNTKTISGVNQRGIIEILPAEDDLVRISYEGSPILDQDRKGELCITNRGQMTIIAPKNIEIEIFNQGGQINDKRFD